MALGDVNALFTSAFGAGSAEGGLPMFSGSLPSVSPCANCSASAINVKLMVSWALDAKINPTMMARAVFCLRGFERQEGHPRLLMGVLTGLTTTYRHKLSNDKFDF